MVNCAFFAISPSAGGRSPLVLGLPRRPVLGGAKSKSAALQRSLLVQVMPAGRLRSDLLM